MDNMEEKTRNLIWWGMFPIIILIGVLFVMLTTKEEFWLTTCGIALGLWIFFGYKIIDLFEKK